MKTKQKFTQEQVSDHNCRIRQADATNASASMVAQYEAEGFMYSVIHHPAQYRPAMDPAMDAIFAESWNLVVQLSKEEDPDKAFVAEVSFDNLEEAKKDILDRLQFMLEVAFAQV